MQLEPRFHATGSSCAADAMSIALRRGLACHVCSLLKRTAPLSPRHSMSSCTTSRQAQSSYLSDLHRLRRYLSLGHLPSRCLQIDESADSLHNQRIDRMGAAEARGDDIPVLDPPDAVFYPDAYRAQLTVEFLLLVGQCFPFRLLECCIRPGIVILSF